MRMRELAVARHNQQYFNYSWTAHGFAGGLKKKVDLRSGSHAMAFRTVI